MLQPASRSEVYIFISTSQCPPFHSLCFDIPYRHPLLNELYKCPSDDFGCIITLLMTSSHRHRKYFTAGVTQSSVCGSEVTRATAHLPSAEAPAVEKWRENGERRTDGKGEKAGASRFPATPRPLFNFSLPRLYSLPRPCSLYFDYQRSLCGRER